METAGQKLKQARERLHLRYREVAEASQKIAERHANPEFVIALSRLADIENKGLIPNLYRLYSLSAIYRLELREVMEWYGIPSDPSGDAGTTPLPTTHLANWKTAGLDPLEDCDESRTGMLKRLHRWGAISAGLLPGFDARYFRYAYLGLRDWTMHPILQPGSLLLIDVRRRKVAASGWTRETDRPIYFLEHREGFICGWCSLAGEVLIVQPHPASLAAASAYRWPSEIEVIGQVVGAAMLLDGARHHLPPTVRAVATR